ncbi:hypothetical protein K466DRAFT_570000 [Polyporus arcularius HHB13444]|uniref:Uncharacterized protein n=1 Tax=Polyporus arcularius HHB13444 TaxID=1314778 RepID=A0A5C3NV14_9APHY|nr:hypothetical protein K466DRAFT_570000 [Polyporus arcularius HHB13444]
MLPQPCLGILVNMLIVQMPSEFSNIHEIVHDIDGIRSPWRILASLSKKLEAAGMPGIRLVTEKWYHRWHARVYEKYWWRSRSKMFLTALENHRLSRGIAVIFLNKGVEICVQESKDQDILSRRQLLDHMMFVAIAKGSR